MEVRDVRGTGNEGIGADRRQGDSEFGVIARKPRFGRDQDEETIGTVTSGGRKQIAFVEVGEVDSVVTMQT